MLELKTATEPAAPRNDFDDAVDYVRESATGWAAVSVTPDKVRSYKRNLSKAAKLQGRSLRYSEGKVNDKGVLELTFGLKPIKPVKPAETETATKTEAETPALTKPEVKTDAPKVKTPAAKSA